MEALPPYLPWALESGGGGGVLDGVFNETRSQLIRPRDQSGPNVAFDIFLGIQLVWNPNSKLPLMVGSSAIMPAVKSFSFSFGFPTIKSGPIANNHLRYSPMTFNHHYHQKKL